MKIKSHAKINLYLEITGIKTDGYHELYSVMQEISLADYIDITADSKITVECSDKTIPCCEKNLAYQAALAFFHETHIKGGAKIHIEKNIPHGAGLGGGSSNAAAVIRMLDRIYKTQCSYETLCNIAIRIGADVPFFIQGGCAIAQGIGENLSPLFHSFSAPLIILKPDFSVSTPKAYAEFDKNPYFFSDNRKLFTEALEKGNDFTPYLYNSLEPAVEKMYPEITEYKNILIQSGADGVLMSGSGSCVFGVFSDLISAEKAYKKLSRNFAAHMCSFYTRNLLED